MIKVFEQAKAIDLREIRVGLMLSHAGGDLDGDLLETDGGFERREIRGPWIGLLTSAWTEKAVVAEASGSGLTALAVVTVGLSNRIAAGRTPVGVWAEIGRASCRERVYGPV